MNSPALYSVGEADRKLSNHFYKHLHDVYKDALKPEHHSNLPDHSSNNNAFSKKKRNTGSRKFNGKEGKIPSPALGIGEFHESYF